MAEGKRKPLRSLAIREKTSKMSRAKPLPGTRPTSYKSEISGIRRRVMEHRAVTAAGGKSPEDPTKLKRQMQKARIGAKAEGKGVTVEPKRITPPKTAKARPLKSLAQKEAAAKPKAAKSKAARPVSQRPAIPRLGGTPRAERKAIAGKSLGGTPKASSILRQRLARLGRGLGRGTGVMGFAGMALAGEEIGLPTNQEMLDLLRRRKSKAPKILGVKQMSYETRSRLKSI